jgi:hypothetical protein
VAIWCHTVAVGPDAGNWYRWAQVLSMLLAVHRSAHSTALGIAFWNVATSFLMMLTRWLSVY